MKYTVLQMVQSIMSDMDSDEITAIDDTAESEQVASILRDTYFQLVTNRVVPEHYGLVSLTSAGGTAKVFMAIPSTVARIESIYYDKIESGETQVVYKEIPYVDPDCFLERSFQLDSTASDVSTATDPNSTLTVYIKDEEGPSYWTSFDDQYVCFNSYDSAVDASGLVSTKTRCRAKLIPTWTDDDGTFVPDIDDNYFPLLLAEAKSAAFVALKQAANPKVEKIVRQQRLALQNDRSRTKASEKARTYSTSTIAGRQRP